MKKTLLTAALAAALSLTGFANAAEKLVVAATPVPHAEIISACDAVGVGHALVPFEEVPVPISEPIVFDAYAIRVTRESNGYVVHGRDPKLSYGQGDIINIDMGTSDGIEPGRVFTIYREWGGGIEFASTETYIEGQQQRAQQVAEEGEAVVAHPQVLDRADAGCAVAEGDVVVAEEHLGGAHTRVEAGGHGVLQVLEGEGELAGRGVPGADLAQLDCGDRRHLHARDRPGLRAPRNTGQTESTRQRQFGCTGG